MTTQQLADINTVPEPWTTGVRAVLGPFVAKANARKESADLEACRRKARVSHAVAELFEEYLDEVLPDDDEDEGDEDTEENEAAPAATETAATHERTAS